MLRYILHIDAIRHQGTIQTSTYILLPFPLGEPPLVGLEDLCDDDDDDDEEVGR